MSFIFVNRQSFSQSLWSFLLKYGLYAIETHPNEKHWKKVVTFSLGIFLLVLGLF